MNKEKITIINPILSFCNGRKPSNIVIQKHSDGNWYIYLTFENKFPYFKVLLDPQWEVIFWCYDTMFISFLRIQGEKNNWKPLQI